MRLRYIFFQTLEGGGKTWLGGELRREEQRLSRTGVCVDLEGTVDDLSEGVFAGLSPHLRQHEQRYGKPDSTSTS
jgi:hypothetical protein